jgi:hypothetical protein
MSQKQRIADILESEGRIDNFRSIREKISVRLAARIADLRAVGWEIETHELGNKNTEYVLKSRPAEPPKPPKYEWREVVKDGQRMMRRVLVT